MPETIITTQGGVRKRASVLTKYHPLQIVLIKRANNCLEGKQSAEMCVSEAFYTVIMGKKARAYLKKDNQ